MIGDKDMVFLGRKLRALPYKAESKTWLTFYHIPNSLNHALVTSESVCIITFALLFKLNFFQFKMFLEGLTNVASTSWIKIDYHLW